MVTGGSSTMLTWKSARTQAWSEFPKGAKVLTVVSPSRSVIGFRPMWDHARADPSNELHRCHQCTHLHELSHCCRANPCCLHLKSPANTTHPYWQDVRARSMPALMASRVLMSLWQERERYATHTEIDFLSTDLTLSHISFPFLTSMASSTWRARLASTQTATLPP